MNNYLKEQIKSKLNVESLDNIDEFELNVTNSTVNKMANKGHKSIYGFYITINNKQKKLVAKRKANIVVYNTGNLLNRKDSKDFENTYKANCIVFGLKNSVIREYLIYENMIDDIKVYMPKYLGTIQNPDENILLMEYFDSSNSQVDDDIIIDFLTSLHSYYLNKKEIAKKLMLNYCSIEEYKESKKLLLMTFENFVELCEDIIPKEVLNDIENNVRNMDNIVRKMYSYYLTFTHGDFSYRNMCLVDNKICVYDWEMASYLNPQFDIVNYLVDMKEISKEYIDSFISKYIINFEEKTNMNINRQEFYDIFKVNVDYYFIIRLMGLLVIHDKMAIPTIDEALKNWLVLKDIVDNK